MMEMMHGGVARGGSAFVGGGSGLPLHRATPVPGSSGYTSGKIIPGTTTMNTFIMLNAIC